MGLRGNMGARQVGMKRTEGLEWTAADVGVSQLGSLSSLG